MDILRLFIIGYAYIVILYGSSYLMTSQAGYDTDNPVMNTLHKISFLPFFVVNSIYELCVESYLSMITIFDYFHNLVITVCQYMFDILDVVTGCIWNFLWCICQWVYDITIMAWRVIYDILEWIIQQVCDVTFYVLRIIYDIIWYILQHVKYILDCIYNTLYYVFTELIFCGIILPLYDSVIYISSCFGDRLLKYTRYVWQYGMDIYTYCLNTLSQVFHNMTALFY